jgi:cell division GTPase FtsZ
LKKIKVIGVGGGGGSLMEVVETKVEDKVKKKMLWCG